ncbi:phage tail protein [Calothrix sp. NIES-2098]|uniref:phage tail protein n=1 Tax=Calothrix sp. NIES-2098 TaxID=1954171 RepID=UPI000B6183ED|nr:phage tail protein [Calothrix sp. NIES-2098]
MTVGARKDPYLAFNFLVEIGGLTVGGFSEVNGLQAELEILDYQEGGENQYIHKLPGPVRYPSNLVLKHGLTDSKTLWNWQQDAIKGTIKRFNGSIILQNSTYQEVWRWNFFKAFPARWIGPDLRANTAEVALETLELVHHGMIQPQ